MGVGSRTTCSTDPSSSHRHTLQCVVPTSTPSKVNLPGSFVLPWRLAAADKKHPCAHVIFAATGHASAAPVHARKPLLVRITHIMAMRGVEEKRFSQSGSQGSEAIVGGEASGARIELAYIGGGSIRAPGTIASLIEQGANFDGSEIVLIDLDAERLSVVQTLAQQDGAHACDRSH